MPLHPQAQAFVDTINALDRPPLSEMTVEMARTGLRGLLPPSDEKVGAIADFELRRFIAIFHVLWHFAQRTELVNAIVTADTGVTCYHYMRSDPRSFANFDMLADHRIGADRNGAGKACAWMHERGGMYHSISRTVHMRSASAAREP